jgi:PAS domain S-box-containing protein
MDVQSLLHDLQAHKDEVVRLNLALRHAEAKTALALQRVNDHLDGCPVGCFTLTDDGTICRSNPAGATMLGRDRSCLAGTRLGAFVSTESQAVLDAFLRNAVRPVAEPTKVACELDLADDAGGIVRHLRIDGLRRGAGSVCHVVMTDISPLVTAQKRKAELAAVFDILPDLYFRFESDGRILDYCANRASELYVPPDAFLGRNLRDVLPPDVAEKIAEAITFANLNGGVKTLEYRLPMADGPQDYELRLAPFEQSGELVAVVRNITERKRWEDALLESIQFNEQIISSAQEGIVVYGADLRYRLWSPFMERLTGVSAADVFGRHPGELFPFLREQGVIAKLEEALQGQVSEAVEYPFHIPQTGRFGWSSNVTAPLRNGKGEIIGVISTIRDITDKKRAEVLRAELEGVARLDVVGEMASTIAHELAQPLAATNIYLGACLRAMDEGHGDLDKIRGAMHLAQKQNDFAAGIIGRLRETIRKQGHNRAAMDINALVKDAVDLMEPEIRRHHMSVCLDLSPLPAVHANRVEIVQVLVNLMKNAIESMQTGTAPAMLHLITRSENSREIRVSVSDTGKGIAASERDQLFNPLRTTKKQGLGLGLAISRSMVVNHRGRIWADAQQEVGATFHFTLPVAAANE